VVTKITLWRLLFLSFGGGDVRALRTPAESSPPIFRFVRFFFIIIIIFTNFKHAISMQTRPRPLPSPTLDFHEQTRLRVTILYNNIYIYVHRYGATPARAGRLGETVENVNFYFVIFPNARHEFRTRL